MNQDKLVDDKKEVDFDNVQYDICDESENVQTESKEQNKKFKKIVKKISQAS